MSHALGKLFDGFLLAKEADGVKDTTLETYRVMYKNLVAFFPVEKLDHPETLTPQDMQAWAVSLKHYADATRDQRIAKAKAFFAWCEAYGYLESNPAAILKRPKKTWQPDPFSEEELAFLLAESKRGSMGIRNYALCCFLLDSGIRNTELRNLLVEDVSLKTGQVKIREGKGSKPRTVIIGKRAKEALWKWLMIRPETATHLFCTMAGVSLDRIRLRVIISKIGRRASVRAYPHRFRHTFALQYLKLSGDPYSLQYLLGHEDMSTVREYVKIAAQDASDMYRSPLDALKL